MFLPVKMNMRWNLLFFSVFFLAMMWAAPLVAEGKALNENGWRLFDWGINPIDALNAMKEKNLPFDGEELALSSLWYGFDDNWARKELPVSSLGGGDSFQLVKSGMPFTNLLFYKNALVGVFIHRREPAHVIDSLLTQMTQHYTEAQMHWGDCPDCVSFMHRSPGRLILWDSDGEQFFLAFYDFKTLDPVIENAAASRQDELPDQQDSKSIPAAPTATPAPNTQPAIPTQTPTPALPPEMTPEPTPALTPEPAPTPTPEPTPTPTPEPTPTPPAPGEVWVEPHTKMEFVWIPKGCFVMGQSEAGKAELIKTLGEAVYKKKFRSELPRHEACVSGFWMSKYEVTNEQFRLFAPAHDSGVQDAFSLNKPKQPVGRVSYNQALAFGEWLSAQHAEGEARRFFSLPTEAEWEYACRGGAKTVRYWGDAPELACKYANVEDVQAKKTSVGTPKAFTCDDGHAVAAPVGAFPENPFGLHDIQGNVWEWCLDMFGDYFYVMEQRENPVNRDGYGSARVIRGGGWKSPPSSVRSAAHLGLNPKSTLPAVGFRLVMRVATDEIL